MHYDAWYCIVHHWSVLQNYNSKRNSVYNGKSRHERRSTACRPIGRSDELQRRNPGNNATRFSENEGISPDVGLSKDNVIFETMQIKYWRYGLVRKNVGPSLWRIVLWTRGWDHWSEWMHNHGHSHVGRDWCLQVASQNRQNITSQITFPDIRQSRISRGYSMNCCTNSSAVLINIWII